MKNQLHFSLGHFLLNHVSRCMERRSHMAYILTTGYPMKRESMHGSSTYVMRDSPRFMYKVGSSVCSPCAI